MEPTNKELIDALIKPIQSGDIQLPEFQRDYVWSKRQKSELIESLFQRHPVGTLLLLELNDESPMFAWTELEGTSIPQERSYIVKGKRNDQAKPPRQLILDGQQRLTTLAQLLTNPGTSKYTSFLDLRPMMEHWEAEGKPDTADKLDLWIEGFDFSNNIKALTWIGDPERRLKEKSFRLGISLLFDDTSLSSHVRTFRDFAYKSALRAEEKANKDGISSEKRKEANDEKDDFHRRIEFVDIVLPRLTNIVSRSRIPAVTVPETMSVAGVCKIFTKLNSTGTPLGPFDLAVAKMYPNDINLKSLFKSSCSEFPKIRSVDGSGASLLSTVALLSGKSPKKNSLPDNVTPAAVNTHWEHASDAYENAINHLNEYCGAGISEDGAPHLLAYAPIVPALAVALGQTKLDNIQDHNHRQHCIDALRRWYFQAPLLKHYSEGTDNKQQSDARIFRDLFQNGQKNVPAWLEESARPSLVLTQASGARGKAVLSLYNLQNSKDWFYDTKTVGRGPLRDSSSQLHHIFPREYLRRKIKSENNQLSDDDVQKMLKESGCESILNLAFLTSDSNNSIINDRAPSEYLKFLQSRHKNGDHWKQILRDHFITDEGISAMQNDDLQAFLKSREEAIYARLSGMGAMVNNASTNASNDQQSADLFNEDDLESY